MENVREKNKSTLHFTRVRAKGEPTFYDPATDIRHQLPGVAKVTLQHLQEKYATNDDLLSDFLYIHNCFCVMQIRVAEDKTPCADQMNAFFDAVNKVRRRSLFIWLQNMFVLLVTLYGLFTRRDVRTDGSAIKDIMSTASVVQLLSGLPADLRSRVAEQWQIKMPVESYDERGFVICEETGDKLENIKQLASMFISHTGAHDWTALADACDEQFSTSSVKSDVQNIALALAYPDYEHLCLTVEQK